ncbi:MAG: carboxypeptidase-like regulatory domain-containing protein [Thermoanaerobaculum sp.]
MNVLPAGMRQLLVSFALMAARPLVAGGLLVVSVNDPQGVPVEGPVWIAVERQRGGELETVQPWSPLATNPQGLEFPEGQYRVRCAAVGFAGGASPVVEVKSGSRAVECRLKPTVLVRGKVVDPAGAGVEGAVVTLVENRWHICERQREPLPCRLRAETTTGLTDRNGVFSLRLLPQKEQRLLVEAEGFAPALIPVTPEDQGAVLPPVTLEPGGSLQLTLRNAPEDSHLVLQARPSLVGRDLDRDLWASALQRTPEASVVRWPALWPGLWSVSLVGEDRSDREVLLRLRAFPCGFPGGGQPPGGGKLFAGIAISYPRLLGLGRLGFSALPRSSCWDVLGPNERQWGGRCFASLFRGGAGTFGC